MVREIRIYFEGNEDLRRGFRIFFGEIDRAASQKEMRFRLIHCGSNPVEDYKISLKSNPNSLNFVLRDSEAPYTDALSRRLCRDAGLSASDAKSVFWMVQMMESWFLADRNALKNYYDDERFHEGSLPKNPNVEEISKDDVADGLKRATKNCKKGAYHKRKHAPDILSKIDPERVKKASPQCRRIFETVLAKVKYAP